MTSHPRSMDYPRTASFATEEIKYKRKYRELKKKLAEIEKDNDRLMIRLTRARRHAERLCVERSFLHEKLEQVATSTIGVPEYESASDSGMEDLALADTEDTATTNANKRSATSMIQSTPTGPSRRRTKDSGTPVSRANGGTDHQTPKRPANAYYMFGQMCKRELQTTQPGMTPSEANRFVADKWKSMAPSERQMYQSLFEQEKRQWEAETPTITATVGVQLASGQSLGDASPFQTSSSVSVSNGHTVQPSLTLSTPQPPTTSDSHEEPSLYFMQVPMSELTSTTTTNLPLAAPSTSDYAAMLQKPDATRVDMQVDM